MSALGKTAMLQGYCSTIELHPRRNHLAADRNPSSAAKREYGFSGGYLNRRYSASLRDPPNFRFAENTTLGSIVLFRQLAFRGSGAGPAGILISFVGSCSITGPPCRRPRPIACIVFIRPSATMSLSIFFASCRAKNPQSVPLPQPALAFIPTTRRQFRGHPVTMAAIKNHS